MLQKELRRWHRTNFSLMESQLTFSKKAILFFDRIEERRKLDRREFGLRQKLRERAYELSNNIEIQWHQRSRCNWLTNGDNNTKFFHAFASSRVRKKNIQRLQVEGEEVNGTNNVRKVFFDHLRGMLGTMQPVIQFNPKVMYRQSTEELAHLQLPFTEYEVERAVRQLASNRSCGPDGLPHEFLKKHWELLKGDIMRIFSEFYDNALNLKTLKYLISGFQPCGQRGLWRGGRARLCRS